MAIYIRFHEALGNTHVQFGPFTKVEPEFSNEGGSLTAYQGKEPLFFDWDWKLEAWNSPVKGEDNGWKPNGQSQGWALCSLEIGDGPE